MNVAGLPSAVPAGTRLGHAHFLERAMSRGRFLGAAGGAVAAALWGEAIARAANGLDRLPKPIPGGFEFNGQLFHVFAPGLGNEPLTATDFRGRFGIARIDGAGDATNTRTGETFRRLFDVDVRFFRGVYLDRRGRRQFGTFGFV
jgi:hypothetical protein